MTRSSSLMYTITLAQDVIKLMPLHIKRLQLVIEAHTYILNACTETTIGIWIAKIVTIQYQNHIQLLKAYFKRPNSFMVKLLTYVTE